MTNRKSHTRYRLVPKSTTLDDLEGPLCTLFQIRVFSESIMKISVKMSAMTVWQYKIYADIRGGSLERRRQTAVG